LYIIKILVLQEADMKVKKSYPKRSFFLKIEGFLRYFYEKL